MNKTEIVEELSRLTKSEHQESRSKLAELENDGWLDDEDPLTAHEKELLDARLTTYATDPDTGRTWEEVEGRIRAALITSRTDEIVSDRQARSGS